MAKMLHLAILILSVFTVKIGSAEDVCPAVIRFGTSENPISFKSNIETSFKKNILGFFPIHVKDCASILTDNNYKGVQRAMAMIHGLNLVNDQVRNGNKTIALNGFLYDTCSNEISAIDSFIEGMGSHEPVSGVIGASHSSVTIPLSMMAQAHNVTMLSYAATCEYLSNKQIHSTFARLLPSDHNQARVVFDIVKALANVKCKTGCDTKEVTVVQVLMTKENDYSKSLYEEFKRLMKNDLDNAILICKISEFFLTNSTEEIEQQQLEIESLVQSGVDVVVSFMISDSKYTFLNDLEMALKNKSLKVKPFVTVSTDSWDVDDISQEEVAKFLSGNSLVAIPYPGDPSAIRYGGNFTDFMGSLYRSKYPWLNELWQDMCHDNETCLESPLDLGTFRIDSKVNFVIDAIMALSDALERCHKDQCNERKLAFFENYVLKTSYGVGDDTVKFDCEGNALGKYGIYLLSENGVYKNVGLWNDLITPQLNFNPDIDALQINRNKTWTCRPKCSIDEYEEEFHQISGCCHVCTNIPKQYVKVTPRSIKPCEDGTWANSQKTKCDTLVQETLALSSGWTIMAIAVAVLGLIVVGVVVMVTLKNYHHEKIKSSSRELSIFIWIGAAISHLNIFLVFLTTPSTFICSLLRLSLTVGYTFILSALFLKVHRIFRIFYGQFKQCNEVLGQPKYISPKYQIVFATGLVSIQLLAVKIWLIIDPVGFTHLYPERRHVLVCEVDASNLFIFQIYNVCLCCVGTFYSILTRGVPQNFNESRRINFTMYSVCFIWLMQLIIRAQSVSVKFSDKHFGYQPEKIWALTSATYSALGTIVLLFLYSHRIYQIYWLKPSQPVIVRAFKQSQEIVNTKA